MTALAISQGLRQWRIIQCWDNSTLELSSGVKDYRNSFNTCYILVFVIHISKLLSQA